MQAFNSDAPWARALMGHLKFEERKAHTALIWPWLQSVPAFKTTRFGKIPRSGPARLLISLAATAEGERIGLTSMLQQMCEEMGYTLIFEKTTSGSDPKARLFPGMNLDGVTAAQIQRIFQQISEAVHISAVHHSTLTETIFSNHRRNLGPCNGCPGVSMPYPLVLGILPSPISIFAQDPNYTFAKESERDHRALCAAYTRGDDPGDLQWQMWQLRSRDKRNRLRRLLRSVAEITETDVAGIYYSNVAKCGERSAYAKSDGGRLVSRMNHCRPYLEQEVALTTRVIITFGATAAKQMSKVLKLPLDGSVDANGKSIPLDDGRTWLRFPHWSHRQKGDVLKLVALQDHVRNGAKF